MKIHRQITADTKVIVADNGPDVTAALWRLICYSPKIPVRHTQQQTLNAAVHHQLTVFDEFFTRTDLAFNVFTWGNGERKILLTHGWASKGADFAELIDELRQLDNVQVIAFDAPGNGSSIAELSNLVLFIRAIQAIIAAFGMPEVWIGHSLGCLANVFTLNETAQLPKLLISIAPVVRLRESFDVIMDTAHATDQHKEDFYTDFLGLLKWRLHDINWMKLYNYKVKHLVIYNKEDLLTPYTYLEEVLQAHPEIEVVENNVAHERQQKEPAVIEKVIELIKDI